MKIDDRLVTLKPANKTAARAMAEGEHYEPDINYGQPHWEAPPPTKSVPYYAPNFTGVRFGHFTVIGLYTFHYKKGKASWLVRCDCGDYEIRTTRSVLRANKQDRCKKCLHKLKLQGRLNDTMQNHNHWETQPPLKPVPAGTFDLTGAKYGQFSVVGMCAEGHGKWGLWVVRCSCGDYEVRSTKAIRRADNDSECCAKCRASYSSEKKIVRRHWGDTKPPLRTVPRDKDDFTGTSFGQFTVIGLYAHSSSQWVVRCSCGSYEIRRTRRVKRRNPNDCCDKCWKKAKG